MLARSMRFLSLPAVLALVCTLSAWSDDAKPKAELPADLAPSSVTIQGKAILLSKALTQFAEQTKVAIALPAGEDPKVNLDLKAVPFWKALDEIAKEADMRVYPYLQDGKLALRKGYREMPTSYSGRFRIVLKRVAMARDLETDGRFGTATLEVAWQPPFQGFLLQTRPEGYVVQDDKGLALELPEIGKGQASLVGKRGAFEIDVPMPAVRRAVPSLGMVKGSLAVIGAAKMLTFPLEFKKGEEKTVEGVTVKVASVDTREADRWAVQFALKYPPAGPKFESFQLQDWLFGNRALLFRPGMSQASNDLETDEAPANQALITYRFADNPETKFVLGKPVGWKLEYTTPSPVIEVPIQFEFKDVPLP